ncbi:helix-turn-helix domain-containing protein [Bacteroides sp. BFG-637]|uniref:helix-turn-helix domain-containing protein n=1 Tax=Bacteroides sp. BFG-637 TaxID=2972764 RepID=UPI0021656B1D|nr:helix-turn-helix domain-containing protein [Bacteroides sp. BFG-637]MCS3310663.1 helix-turn-helix domain-containing protein [Bacteroides sp. BFG-637]
MQKSYTKERSISYYADVLCITPKYLSQVIHNISGRFASDWIIDFVILEAKALLKSRKYTVQQVADMLNFANQSFFGKYFKNKVGCSPSEYQKL